MIHLEEYVICKGKHSRFRLPKLTSEDSVTFEVAFTNSCKYIFLDNGQYDINKLFGLSDAWSYHRRYSARVGWRWNTDIGKFEVFAYWYNISKLSLYKKIIELLPYENQEFTILFTSAHYRYYIGSVNVFTVPRGKAAKRGLKYMLFPYFGGNKTAPHDMTILCKLKM